MIGVVPITFDPILIAPVVLVAVVEFDPIFKAPVVCDGTKLKSPINGDTELLIFVPAQSIDQQ